VCAEVAQGDCDGLDVRGRGATAGSIEQVRHGMDISNALRRGLRTELPEVGPIKSSGVGWP
jgi:hypothetical protein